MKHSYKILSARKCKHPGCGKYFKQNLIDRNPDAEQCFKHYPKSKKNREGANLPAGQAGKKPEVVL